MPVDRTPFRACLDANVLISAIAFGGKPLKVVDLLFSGGFTNVVSPRILGEVERNLVYKLGLDRSRVETFLSDLVGRSVMAHPRGAVPVTGYPPDDELLALVSDTRCRVLVTGDRKHLLPLGSHRGVAIEPPSVFLLRFDKG